MKESVILQMLELFDNGSLIKEGREITDKEKELEEEFTKLSPKHLELKNQLEDVMAESFNQESKAYFKAGFKLGLKLGMECIED